MFAMKAENSILVTDFTVADKGFVLIPHIYVSRETFLSPPALHLYVYIERCYRSRTQNLVELKSTDTHAPPSSEQVLNSGDHTTRRVISLKALS